MDLSLNTLGRTPETIQEFKFVACHLTLLDRLVACIIPADQKCPLPRPITTETRSVP